MDGGYGLLVDIKLKSYSSEQKSILCSIITSDGQIEDFSYRDLDVADTWSEDE
jgi:hypothetical protein